MLLEADPYPVATEMDLRTGKLSEADWQKVTAAEKWPVGVTAHHVAGAHEAIAGMAKTIGRGQALPHFTMAMLDETSLEGKVLGEAATRARQAGVPCFAVVGTNALDAFGARILDIQRVLEAPTIDALEHAAEDLVSLLPTR